MNFQKTISILAFSILLFACTKNKTPEELWKDWKTFETENCDIKYPGNWDLNESGFEGTSFLIVSKQTSIRDFFQENIRLTIDSLTNEDDNRNDYVKRNIKQLESKLKNFKMLENVEISEEHQSYHKLIFEMSTDHGTISIENHYYSEQNKIYILSFLCKVRELNRYQPIGEAMMKSFTLK